MAKSFGENALTWSDMSNHVVHFTKPSGNKSAYDNMLSILGQKIIKARNPFGLVRKGAPNPSSQKTVCFSEVPLHLLQRLAKTRSEYGIVFGKELVIKRRANPILYAYKDQPLAKAIRKLALAAKANANDPIWTVTPFVDAAGVYPSGAYLFEWEREWRKIGDFEFSEAEVTFLIIPAKYHAAARAFFDNARIENIGPHYDCPFIDAKWGLTKIRPLLKAQKIL